MTYLLDVNVVIALIDPQHTSHRRAHQWLGEHSQDVFATCPIVENGVLRIVGHPRYPGTPGSPFAVMKPMLDLRSAMNCVFWADSISLLDAPMIAGRKLERSSQITDSYLLALASTRGAQLATFDTRLDPSGVLGGSAALYVIKK